MKKILVVQGGGRFNGNTSQLAERLSRRNGGRTYS